MKELTLPSQQLDCPDCGESIEVQVRLAPFKMVGEQVTAHLLGTYEHTCE